MNTKINLLPDVRLTKLRDKRNRRLAVSVMTSVIFATAGILVAGFLIVQGQAITIHTLTSGINGRKEKISSHPNVKTMLSLQARTAALPGLYSQRTVMTKVYQILSGVEPRDVAFTGITLDSNNLLTITAQGRSYLAAARIAHALEQSNLTLGEGASQSNQAHFTDVSLSAVTLATNITSFSITAKVSPGVLHAK